VSDETNEDSGGVPPQHGDPEAAHGGVVGTTTVVAAPVEALVTGDPKFAEQLSIAARNPAQVETVVGLLFFISLIGGVAFAALFFFRDQPQLEGITLFVMLAGLGMGMAAWGKYLMPKGPFVEEREVLTTPENQQKFAATFARASVAVEGRRSVLVKLMVAAMGTMGVALLFPIRSLARIGPSVNTPGLYNTGWFAGSKLISQNDGQPVHVDDLAVGGVLTVLPENSTDPADDQTILLRPGTTPQFPANEPFKKHWSPQGYLAFSKVCTHAGCPVGQYESQFQKLLCPCHESTFDVLNAAAVVFGPAPRPLPQLPLMVDSDGFLRAAAPYGEPVGPGFWSRGGLK
jgi:ubiquinol-cytochrome c reductase iron-sulfur subunit